MLVRTVDVAFGLVMLVVIGGLVGCMEVDEPTGQPETLAVTQLELDSVKDCTSNQKSDITAAANVVKNNWTDFERYVEERTGLSIGSCLRNRFESNGKVVCESRDTGMCEPPTNAWASPFNRKAHLCSHWLNDVARHSHQPNRRACYAYILAHEWAHTCDRFEGEAGQIGDAAFFWYKENYNVTIRLAGCH